MPLTENVTIAVDAMGGDNAPSVVLDGVAAALTEDENLQVVLVGPADVVEPFASTHNRCTAAVATEVIGMAEHPAEAVRKKKDSSIVIGCKLVKEGKAQGFFSAGSTGACLAGATLGIGRIKGVSRPCLCSVIPSPVAPVVMADIGANADCKPEYLAQFAQMASIYAEKIVGIKSPKCALLNIGEEDTKGSQFAQAAFAQLKEKVPNFVGNCEGRDIIRELRRHRHRRLHGQCRAQDHRRHFENPVQVGEEGLPFEPRHEAWRACHQGQAFRARE